MNKPTRSNASKAVRAAVPVQYASVFKDGKVVPHRAAKLLEGAGTHAERHSDRQGVLGW